MAANTPRSSQTTPAGRAMPDSTTAVSARSNQLSRHPVYNKTGADLFVFDHARKFFFDGTADVTPAQLANLTNRWNTEDSAYIPERLTAEDFENFLWVFYNPTIGVFEASVDKWVCILKLAWRWGGSGIVQLAVDKIKEKEDTLPLVELFLKVRDAARTHAYSVRLFARLAMRDTRPTPEEKKLLGDSTTIMLYELRDILRSSDDARSSSPLVGTEDAAAEAASAYLNGLRRSSGDTPAPPSPSNPAQPVQATPSVARGPNGRNRRG
ncbi:hypothetical protein CC1G_10866 [Coprinopsis cinerea okayama7|uniref:Uncharacterized protein n=1 Tax=Coprinopsis cinerea (strain Okayama-7 / 130 / ATCC MYA-4618 / FGSC 9003) TaxID=240176 RepID=A8NKU6_COPC7|nr:hypothetical protein CC1G_10866 [Coprinopsis cinerea okayama7\|eukprot:XP_001834548.2 hypothetical protein CC1G_10866 [Coprinopsis cinerea okayama7\